MHTCKDDFSGLLELEWWVQLALIIHPKNCNPINNYSSHSKHIFDFVCFSVNTEGKLLGQEILTMHS